MKEIPLTQGQVALVDDEDYERVNSFKWYAHWAHRTKTFYATRKTKRPNQQHIYMHRFIMNTPDDMLCDHANHNTLDNRKVNLRNCTTSQNQMNKGALPNNKLGLKDISWDKQAKKYVVHLEINEISVFRKRFNTLEEAITARDEAVKKYHGEFACLNFV